MCMQYSFFYTGQKFKRSSIDFNRIYSLETQMADHHQPLVIDLDDQPQQHQTNNPSTSDNPPTTPSVGLDQKEYPKMAMLLKKKLERYQPILIADDSPAKEHSLLIEPMKEQSIQVEAKELVKIGSKLAPQITVVEDLKGIPVPDIEKCYTQKIKEALRKKAMMANIGEVDRMADKTGENLQDTMRPENSSLAQKAVVELDEGKEMVAEEFVQEIAPIPLEQVSITSEIPLRNETMIAEAKNNEEIVRIQEERSPINQVEAQSQPVNSPENLMEPVNQSNYLEQPINQSVPAIENRQEQVDQSLPNNQNEICSMQAEMGSEVQSSFSGYQLKRTPSHKVVMSAPNGDSDFQIDGSMAQSQRVCMKVIEQKSANQEEMVPEGDSKDKNPFEEEHETPKFKMVISNQEKGSLQPQENIFKNVMPEEIQNKDSSEKIVLPEAQQVHKSPQPEQKSKITEQFNWQSLEDLNKVRQQLALFVPNLRQGLASISPEELKEIYEATKEDLKIDLFKGQLPLQIVENVENIQKQSIEKNPAKMTEIQVDMSIPIVNQTQRSMEIIESARNMEIQEPSQMVSVEENRKEAVEQVGKGQESDCKNLEEVNPLEKSEEVISQVIVDNPEPIVIENIAQSSILEEQKVPAQEIANEKHAQPVVNNEPENMKPTESMQIQSPAKSSEQPVQKPKEFPELTMPIAEVRIKLIEQMPDLAEMIKNMRDQELRNVLLYSNNMNKLKNQSSEEKQSKPHTEKEKEPTIEEIIQKCSIEFPDIGQELRKMSEDKIREIYGEIKHQLKANNIKGDQVQKPKSIELEVQAEKKQDKVETSKADKKVTLVDPFSPQASLKRVPEQPLEMKAFEAEKKEKKKRVYSPEEIRKKLISKLPNLEQHIMKLDDDEVERIFQESVEKKISDRKNSKQSSDQIPNNEEKKPTHIVSSRNPRNSALKSGDNVKVVDGLDERKRRKTRTVIMVHTEMDLSDSQKDGRSKMTRNENGTVRKCNCECCRKLDVNELLRRLGDLIEEKK